MLNVASTGMYTQFTVTGVFSCHVIARNAYSTVNTKTTHTYLVFTRTWLRYVRVSAVTNPSVCQGLSVC